MVTAYVLFPFFLFCLAACPFEELIFPSLMFNRASWQTCMEVRLKRSLSLSKPSIVNLISFGL